MLQNIPMSDSGDQARGELIAPQTPHPAYTPPHPPHRTLTDVLKALWPLSDNIRSQSSKI